MPERSPRRGAILPCAASPKRAAACASGPIWPPTASVARALARRIDYRAGHLVVAQAFLPWLDEAGMLGGRSFDVAMSRYPFAEIHRRLDQAAAEIGGSPTIADFRADPDLVARETALLARARRIITPHHGIAALFPAQAMRLAWHRPPASRAPGRSRRLPRPDHRAPAARHRARLGGGARDAADRVRQAARRRGFLGRLADRAADFGPGWLDGIGAILHPATLTSQPRRLLEALAAGVTIYATPASGLDPADYVPLGALRRRSGGDRGPGRLTGRVNLLFTSQV